MRINYVTQTEPEENKHKSNILTFSNYLNKICKDEKMIEKYFYIHLHIKATDHNFVRKLTLEKYQHFNYCA